jgi:hypothetical protein
MLGRKIKATNLRYNRRTTCDSWNTRRDDLTSRPSSRGIHDIHGHWNNVGYQEKLDSSEEDDSVEDDSVEDDSEKDDMVHFECAIDYNDWNNDHVDWGRVSAGHKYSYDILGRRSRNKKRKRVQPLRWEVSECYAEVLRLLLAREDVEVNTQDKNGDTPLLLAAYVDWKEAVSMLVQHKDVIIPPGVSDNLDSSEDSSESDEGLPDWGQSGTRLNRAYRNRGKQFRSASQTAYSRPWNYVRNIVQFARDHRHYTRARRDARLASCYTPIMKMLGERTIMDHPDPDDLSGWVWLMICQKIMVPSIRGIYRDTLFGEDRRMRSIINCGRMDGIYRDQEWLLEWPDNERGGEEDIAAEGEAGDAMEAEEI